MNNKTPDPDSSSKQQARLRIVGIIMLLLGIGSACLVYWKGNRSADFTDDPSMAGYNKPESRQMGVLYGKMGLMVDDFLDDLKRPGTQATIIVAAAALVASGCFYFARLSERDDEPR